MEELLKFIKSEEEEEEKKKKKGKRKKRKSKVAVQPEDKTESKPAPEAEDIERKESERSENPEPEHEAEPEPKPEQQPAAKQEEEKTTPAVAPIPEPATEPVRAKSPTPKKEESSAEWEEAAQRKKPAGRPQRQRNPRREYVEKRKLKPTTAVQATTESALAAPEPQPAVKPAVKEEEEKEVPLPPMESLKKPEEAPKPREETQPTMKEDVTPVTTKPEARPEEPAKNLAASEPAEQSKDERRDNSLNSSKELGVGRGRGGRDRRRGVRYRARGPTYVFRAKTSVEQPKETKESTAPVESKPEEPVREEPKDDAKSKEELTALIKSELQSCAKSAEAEKPEPATVHDLQQQSSGAEEQVGVAPPPGVLSETKTCDEHTQTSAEKEAEDRIMAAAAAEVRRPTDIVLGSENIEELKKEIELTNQITYDFAKQIGALEHELESEKKRRQEAEEKLFDLLQQKQAKEGEGSMMCLADGKPGYSVYSNLLESAVNIQNLLDLANEELKNKSGLLRKVLRYEKKG